MSQASATNEAALSIRQLCTEVAAGVWLLGILVAMVLHLVRVRIFVRRLGSVEPPDVRFAAIVKEIGYAIGLANPPRVIVTSDFGPGVVGTFRPTVVLPRRLLRADHSTLRSVVGHELAHLRRGDSLVAAIQRLVIAIYWFHPAVWWASSQLTAAREQCCDQETVAGLGLEPEQYAQSLLNVASRRGLLLGVNNMHLTQSRLELLMDCRVRFHGRPPRWSWLVAALVALLVLPGAGLLSSQPALGADPPAVKTNAAFRGVAVFLKTNVTDLAPEKAAVDKIAATGADTIFLDFPVYQLDGSSKSLDTNAAGAIPFDKLGELIDYCRSRKLRVGIEPILLLEQPRGNEWRGMIKPPSWAEWFESYRGMIDKVADLSEAHGAELLVVGSELVSAEAPHLDEWTTTIKSVRSRFKGKLTYCANWDRYQFTPFWDQLDLIGMNSYWRMGKDEKVSVEQIDQNWEPIHESVDQFATASKKPVIFLEMGWCSLANAAKEPWDSERLDVPADPDLQRRLYQSFFDTWYGDPKLGGFMMWEWPSGPPAEKGYTPEGKPAEAVLRTNFAKQTWKFD